MSVQVPKGYQQTEVGVIPEDWNNFSIGDLISFQGGSQPDKSFFSYSKKPGYIRLIQIRDYKTDKFEVFVPKNLVRRFCNENDIMIGRYGPPVFQILRGISGAYNVALIKATPSELINKEYAYYYFKQDSLFNFIDKLSQRSSGQTGVDLKELRAYPFVFPAQVSEQEAIVKALSDADALIESLEQLIAKKRQIKQGAMQELLTGMRRLPGFSGEWKVKRLEAIADIDPEQLSSKTLPEYEFKYISLEDVDFGSLVSHSQQVFYSAPSRARRKLRKNDILVSTVRPNLKSHLWFQNDGVDWVCSTGFSVIRCHTGVANPGYLFSHLFAENINKQIDALLTGSNYPAINSRDVRQLEIPLPEFDEQVAISEILNDLDLEVVALQSRLDKARQIKQAMMQELLTGHIRLL